jgi:two-component system response regulator AtoC
MGKQLPNAGNGKGAGDAAGLAWTEFVGGIGPSMRAMEGVIRELAQSDVPVLLLGERGAGKHTTAQRIHEMSRRNGQPFRVLPCAFLKPEEFNQLAAGSRAQGPVFLKELADLDADCQAQLLQVLPNTEGNGSAISLGIRLIVGSARDLEVEVRAGRLREDLYYGISGVCLRLPPLRQRREDIPSLMDHFLQKYARDFQRPVLNLSAETLQLFQEYSWPGNLKELEDAAKALMALGDETIAMGGLRALLRGANGTNGGRVSLKEASRAASREAERELILKALTRTRWNRRRAAEELQISYKALLYKLKQIGYEGYGAS